MQFELNKPIYNFGVVEVLRSNSEQYPKGSHLYGIFNFAQYSVINGPPGASSSLPPLPPSPLSLLSSPLAPPLFFALTAPR